MDSNSNKADNNTNKSKDYFNISNWASRYSFSEAKNEINKCHAGNCACLKCHPLEDILN